MKHFKFRLSRVLRVRKVEEEVASSRFRECASVIQRAHGVADSLAGELERARAELTETRIRKLSSPAELLLAHNTLQTLEATLIEQRRRIAELQLEADRLRLAWERARQERRALEQLEDHRRRDHFDELEKLANQDLDEIALRRASSPPDETRSSLALGLAEEPTDPDLTYPR